MRNTINLDEFFDRIYCINLKSRPDRLVAFKKNFKALGTSNITYIEAIDGKAIDIGDWKYSPGSLGCRLSHLSIYEDAIKNNYIRILILEDDAIIHNRFRQALYKIIETVNNDWDMIYFGGAHFATPQKINNYVIRLKGTTTTHAIAINCSSLPKILALLAANSNQVIDVALADLQSSQLKVYSPAKPMAQQMEGYSDIEETHVDYNVSLLSKVWYKIKKYWDRF